MKAVPVVTIKKELKELSNEELTELCLRLSKFKKEIETLRKTTEPDKFEDKLEQTRNKEVKALLFDEYLRVTNNEKEGNQSLTKFFGKK